MPTVARKLARALRPGGQLIFRDYGRYDLAQLRFKKGRRLDENFYARADGTLCYYFTPDDVRKLFVEEGLDQLSCDFIFRTQLNRATQLERRRVFVEAHFRKPL